MIDMIDIDILRSSFDFPVSSDGSQQDITISFIVVYAVAFFMTLFMAAVVGGTISKIGFGFESSQRSSLPVHLSEPSSTPMWVGIGATVVIMIIIGFVSTPLFMDEHDRTMKAQEEKDRAIELITDVVAETYGVDDIKVLDDGVYEERNLGRSPDTVADAVEKNDPEDLPVIHVEDNDSDYSGAYAVSFDNDTGETTLFNADGSDDSPIPVSSSQG